MTDPDVTGEPVVVGDVRPRCSLGGPGLVAVGFDRSDGEQDAAVWTSPDGITWFRVPHDEAVFGGVGDQMMFSVTAGSTLGLVAVGLEGAGNDFDAAVWVAATGD